MSTLATFAIALYGEITWWSSVALLSIYVLLILVVIIDDLVTGSSTQKTDSYLSLENTEKDKGTDPISSNNRESEMGMVDSSKGGLAKGLKGIIQKTTIRPKKMNSKLSDFGSIVQEASRRKGFLSLYVQKKLKMIRQRRQKRNENNQTWTKMIENFDFMQLVERCIDSPFEFLILITCPAVNEE